MRVSWVLRVLLRCQRLVSHPTKEALDLRSNARMIRKTNELVLVRFGKYGDDVWEVHVTNDVVWKKTQLAERAEVSRHASPSEKPQQPKVHVHLRLQRTNMVRSKHWPHHVIECEPEMTSLFFLLFSRRTIKRDNCEKHQRRREAIVCCWQKQLEFTLWQVSCHYMHNMTCVFYWIGHI